MSRPVRVHFAGWESDTYRLEGEGWQLSAEQDVIRGTMRLAIRNQKLGLVGMSVTVDWDYQKLMKRPGWMPDLPIIHMESIGAPHHIHYRGPMVSLRDFRAVSGVPQFIEEPIRNFEDLVHFAPVATRQLILPEATVTDLLGRVLELQEPARQEHFLKQAKEDRIKLKVEANLMSFAA